LGRATKTWGELQIVRGIVKKVRRTEGVKGKRGGNLAVTKHYLPHARYGGKRDDYGRETARQGGGKHTRGTEKQAPTCPPKVSL